MRPRRGSDQSGFISAWLAGVLFACWFLAGLVLDSGQALRHRSDGFGAAAAAARAGAQELDESYATVHGDVRLDEARARAAAASYLEGRAVTLESVTFPATDQIHVTVNGTTDFQILPGSVDFEVSATVTAVQGDAT